MCGGIRSGYACSVMLWLGRYGVACHGELSSVSAVFVKARLGLAGGARLVKVVLVELRQGKLRLGRHGKVCCGMVRCGRVCLGTVCCGTAGMVIKRRYTTWNLSEEKVFG